MPTTIVSEYYIKDIVKTLNKNIDAHDIFMHVSDAEIFNMSEITGDYFYDYLLNAFTANTLTADEITLVAKMKPAIAYRAASECAFFLAGQIFNKGPQSQSGDNSAAVGDSYMYKLSYKIRQRAEAYEVKVLQYLEDYKYLYPQYTSSLNNPTRTIACDGNPGANDIFFI